MCVHAVTEWIRNNTLLCNSLTMFISCVPVNQRLAEITSLIRPLIYTPLLRLSEMHLFFFCQDAHVTTSQTDLQSMPLYQRGVGLNVEISR